MNPFSLLLVFAAIISLVRIANRINVAYPIVLVLGGVAIGFIPNLHTTQLPPAIILAVLLPPLLYWESVTAPTSEFRHSAWWIFQMAFGLVLATTLLVAWVAHAIIPGMPWGVAFVLGAIVSSTDEVAFSAVADSLRVPRHLIGTIEGESLVNDATSLTLYAIGIAAVVGASFSILHAFGSLVLSVIVSIAIGLIVGIGAVLAWRSIKDDTLQGLISLMAPFVSYLPAYYLGMSGVLATVTTGLFVTRYTPVVLQPRARELVSGFWVTIVFAINAFIFIEAGISFHSLLTDLQPASIWQLIWWGTAIALTCIIVRLVWVFLQGLGPIANEPEHKKPDWSHNTLLGWTGMRGGVSLAAAFAIPMETVAGPFPERQLVIFLTFCVLLATLVVQGGTLPYLIRWLHIKDDGVNSREERRALAVTAKAALDRLQELDAQEPIPPKMLEMLRTQFGARWQEFSGSGNANAASMTARYRDLECKLLDAQRGKLTELRNVGNIDNTVMRRIQRLLDLETTSVQLLGATGHPDITAIEDLDR